MKSLLSATFLVAALLSFSISGTVKAADDNTKEGESAVQFIELSPLLLPVINKRGVTQMVSLVIAVEVDSQEKADKVNKYSPRLADAYLSDLYGVFSNKPPKNGIIPIHYLKERLNKMSGKVLGDEVVDDVLVQVMQSRRT